MQKAIPSSQGLELEAFAIHWLCLSIFLKKLGRYLISHIMEDDGWLLWIYHSKFFSSPENSPALSLASRHFHLVGKAPIVLNITFSHFNFCSKTSFVLNKYLSLWRYTFSSSIMIEKHYFLLFFLHFYSEARPMVLNLCSPKTGAENLDIIGFHFISPTSHKWSRLSLGRCGENHS